MNTLDLQVEEAWNRALASWNHPSLPPLIAPRTPKEMGELGERGHQLQRELAFMEIPTFQTYANLQNILSAFSENPQRGLQAVLNHEQGHRFCPYDAITLILLNYAAKQGLESINIPYSKEAAAKTVLNLFADMCINTARVRKNDQDIPWAYQQLSKKKKESALWRVYGTSMELAWNLKLLPSDTEISAEEGEAAASLAAVFEGDVLDRERWQQKMRTYASILGKFLEEQRQDQGASLDNIAGNIPQHLDEQTTGELAKRLAGIGSDGLPTKAAQLKKFREILAGFGQGDPVRASITFYEMLSRAYDVTFAAQPFGRPRMSPYRPITWHPSMGADTLDVEGSIATSGAKLIPGITTRAWVSRKRERTGGLEEVVPDLDIFLDSSESMPNPLEEISLPVLAGFVVAKKAHRKGAHIRATNFSGEHQSATQEWTREVNAIYRNLTNYFKGGTVFPHETLKTGMSPRQVLIITDTFLANTEETARAIQEISQRNPKNKVTIYAIHPVAAAEKLRTAGAEIIQGITTDIFKSVIGKANEVYVR